jgi:dihydroneopterin aldolase/2-amino-4-hydroxy-6-hydroxymethyldihydropteridine diphosphokinase
VSLFTEKSYNLIESVGDKICSKLLEYYPIKKVIIKIRKPHAPIMANLDTVEVELEREKL